MKSLQSHRDTVHSLMLRWNNANSLVKTERKALHLAKRKLRYTEKAQWIIQSLAQEIQQKAHKQITQVVSSCIAAVFEDPYEFNIEFVRKRNRTEAKLTFLRDGHAYIPMDETGLGVVDVASFALRVACLALSQPKKRGALFLDEPFRFPSEEYPAKIGQMLLTLGKDLGIQFVLVTHKKELAVGTVIHIKSQNHLQQE